jgi:hypothetical protein
MKPGQKQIVSSTGPVPLAPQTTHISPEVPILTLKIALLVQVYAFKHIFTLFAHFQSSHLVISRTVAILAPPDAIWEMCVVHRVLIKPRVRRDLWAIGTAK